MSQKGAWLWRDLMTTQPEAAEAFYAELFGWTVKHLEMGESGIYRMFSLGEARVGGIVTLPVSDGVPDHWVGYLGVDDVDATVLAAPELGAVIGFGPRDIPDDGRFALIVDPQGAPVSPMTRPVDVPAPDYSPGSFCWMELHTADIDAAIEFYADVFGWSFQEVQIADATRYALSSSGGIDRGGIMQAASEGPAAWLQYVAVEDVDETANKAAELGGTVAYGPNDIPGVGRFAILSDPVGAALAVLQPAST